MNELAKIEKTPTGFYVVPSGATPDAIRNGFPPASNREIGKAIAMLFTGLRFAERGDMNAAMTEEIYSACLRGRPAFAIEAAVQAYLTGQVPGASPVFVPATAELVREVERQFWMRIRREKAEAQAPAPIPKRTAEEIERARKIVETVKGALQR
ncbi:MAG TPA: hypothetical protein VFU31_11395 [Candidatus Binatia bacterium]|nr:hypothetical protein [Candidatus Binatia bacterium]